MRTIKTALASVALAAVALTGVAAGPADSATRNKCRTSSTTGGAKVVKRTSSLVVFTKRLRTYGCAYSGGPIKELLDEGGGIRAESMQLSGRYAGYATYGSAIGDEFDRVVVWDLKTGRALFRASSNFVSDIALKPNGSVAWTQQAVVLPADQNRTIHEVRAFSVPDREGDVLLDRGEGIDPKSLALSSDQMSVTWTRGGATRSRELR